MKDRFIELAELVVDVVISQGKRSSLDRCSKESFPPEYRGRIKVRHIDGTISDDNRFDPNYNIRPNSLSNTAQIINQALNTDDYTFLWYEDDFDQKIIVQSKYSPDVRQKAIEILTYATKHDCWNYDHFWDIDGNIKDRIYLKKSDARGLMNRHHIKYSFKLDEAFDTRAKPHPQESDEKLCERLKKEGKDELSITRALKEDYPEISNYRLGKLVRPLPLPPDKDTEKTRDCYRGRGKMLIKKASLKKNA